jgi:hypothetical protein
LYAYRYLDESLIPPDPDEMESVRESSSEALKDQLNGIIATSTCVLIPWPTNQPVVIQQHQQQQYHQQIQFQQTQFQSQKRPMELDPVRIFTLQFACNSLIIMAIINIYSHICIVKFVLLMRTI